MAPLSFRFFLSFFGILTLVLVFVNLLYYQSISDSCEEIIHSPKHNPCNCSNHGICFNKKCYCDQGWSGNDCGHEINPFGFKDMKMTELVIIFPMTPEDESRVVNNIRLWEDITRFPCTNTRYSKHIDLMFYINENWGMLPLLKSRILSTFAKMESVLKCFNYIGFISADAEELEVDWGQTDRKKNQFFYLWNLAQLSKYDYFFYMEPDAVPIRTNWMERMYEEVAFVPDEFWVKGSISRTSSGHGVYGVLCDPDEHPSCYEQCRLGELDTPNCKSECTCWRPQFLHINGCAFYNLKNRHFLDFILKVRAETQTQNFDSAWFGFLASSKQFYYLCTIIHYFIYTDFIQNHSLNEVSRQDILSHFPNTYMLHTKHLAP